MQITYRGAHRADGRPSFLEVRGLIATPGYVGIRRYEEPAHRRGPALTPRPVTEADTAILNAVPA